jgi:hypothetical protein
MIADGANGTITLNENSITIKRKFGLFTFLNQGLQGDKTISLKSITAIQLRQPGMMLRGYIRFSINGRDPVGGISEALKDENAVMIGDDDQFAQFQQLKDEIESRLHAQQNVSNPVADQASNNVIDELEKLVGLVERGFVTREEFEERKRTILGRA